MNLLTKQKWTHRLSKRTYGCQEEGWKEEVVRDFQMDMYVKWITILLYSTGNSAQCYMAAWMGGEFGEECSLVAKSWLTLLRPHGSFVCGILRARILDRVAISSSRGYSWPRNIYVSCTDRQTLYHWATREVFGGEWIHVYVWLSPFAVHLKLSQHC